MSLHYKSDVRTMSDEELKFLSEEILEAYRCAYEDRQGFTDSEAEDRYYEMLTEIQTREWDRLTPEEREARKLKIGRIGELALEMLSNNVSRSAAVKRTYQEAFTGLRIGDTALIRKPPRFLV